MTEQQQAERTTLTDAAIDALSGRELDEAVHTALGKSGESYWMASRDGGKSISASTLDRDCWPTEGSLRHWLKDQHDRGYSLDHEIVRGVRYHPYHTDTGAALGLLLNSGVRGWNVSDDIHDGHVCVWVTRLSGDKVLATGPSADIASVMCRAFLKLAKGSV